MTDTFRHEPFVRIQALRVGGVIGAVQVLDRGTWRYCAVPEFN